MFYLRKKLNYFLLFVFLFFSLAPAAIVHCEQEKPEDAAPQRKPPELAPGKWEPLFELGENIYPSLVISTATIKEGLWDDPQHIGDKWGTIGIAVRGSQANCPVTVEISGGNFIKPSILSATLADKGKVYFLYPDLKYDYEKLLLVRQTVPEMLSFKVTIGKNKEPEKTVRVQVRSVNECVYNFVDSAGNVRDISYFFAAYVNENHPFISQILKEAMDAKKVDSFSGYSGDKESLMAEIEAVWDTLQRRNIHYSTLTASADDDNPYLASQYVRQLGESINYTQANCVDGSVLMASIFRKLGLDASLIELPGHMLVSVSLDEDGKEKIYIETTLLVQSTLEEAIEEGGKQYEESKGKFDSEKEEDEAYNIVNVQSARVLGIIPIKDSSIR